MASPQPQDTEIEVLDPNTKLMTSTTERMTLDDSSSKYNDAPNNYLPLSAVSVLFCPLIGLLAVILSYTSTRWFEEGKKKQARRASRDAKFSAFFAIGAGIAIGFFFLFLYVFVPLF